MTMLRSTVDSLITHTPCDRNSSSPVEIGKMYVVYGNTSKHGATRWSTSDINMCGRQKDMLAFVGMGYKGVDCSNSIALELEEKDRFGNVRLDTPL